MLGMREKGEREERDAVGGVGREDLEERRIHGEGFLKRMREGEGGDYIEHFGEG